MLDLSSRAAKYQTLPDRTLRKLQMSRILLFLCLFAMLVGCHRSPQHADYPDAKWIPRLVQAGFDKGRHQRKVDLIILYTTEHTAEDAMDLWRKSDSMSGHYMVTRNGEVWQFLKDADTGWHAGNHEYNLRSIAVAVEGYAEPENAEDQTNSVPFPTYLQLESLTHLIKWLCDRHQIPVDRAHIIGKNQVPGVSTKEFPASGPQFWGGASNKISPGARWNWEQLMEKLGHKADHRVLVTLKNSSLTTLPETNAPVIATITNGATLEAYDSYGGYFLVLDHEDSPPQPYLTRLGRFHWDGWVDARCVRLIYSGNDLKHKP